MERAHLTVVVSTDASQRRLSQCLESIDSQIIPDGLVVTKLIKRWNRGPNRGRVLAEAATDLVLFLDADCTLPDQHYFGRLLEVVMTNPSSALIGGLYLDGDYNTYLDRSYNSLCNLWVKGGIDGKGRPANLLGGCLIVNRLNLKGYTIREDIEQWGAEDTRLIRELCQQGALSKFDERLSVRHSPDNSIRKSISRAWIHGRMRQQHQLGTRFAMPQVRLFATHPILAFSPFIAGHFSVVLAASVIQRAAGRRTKRA